MVLSDIDMLIEGAITGRRSIQSVAEYILSEQLTPGLERILTQGGLKCRCQDCNFPVPVYRGRYPMKCPQCGADLDFGNQGGGGIGSEPEGTEVEVE